MDGWTILVDILVLLAAALVLGIVAERLRQSALVGYLLAGMIVGPNALRLVGEGERVEVLAELGVALLLFTIGLEFSWRRLRALGAVALVGGSLQVVLTTILGAGAAMAMGLAPAAAIAVGACVALSSTACVIRVLTRRAELDSQHGRAALGILLVQDIAMVPLVLIVTLLGDQGTLPTLLLDSAKTLGLAALLVGAFVVVFHFVFPRLLGTRLMTQERDLPTLLAAITAIGSAWAAHTAGVSPALGAFVAGVLLGGSPFAAAIRADVTSLRTLLVTLFFASVGMLADPAWMLERWWTVAFVVAAVVVGKALLAWFALRRCRLSQGHAMATGLGLAQIGEFSFVIVGAASGTLLGGDAVQLIVSAAIVTLVLTPYLVAAAPRVGAWWQMYIEGTAGDGAPTPISGATGPSVIVVGYGPAGREVVDALVGHCASVRVIDFNPAIVGLGAQCGFVGVIGDATQPQILERAGLRSPVDAVVVTLPDSDAARRIILAVRGRAPDTTVIVRGRYHIFRWMLEQAGADVVVDEESQVGRRLAAELRRLLRAKHDPTEVARSA